MLNLAIFTRWLVLCIFNFLVIFNLSIFFIYFSGFQSLLRAAALFGGSVWFVNLDHSFSRFTTFFAHNCGETSISSGWIAGIMSNARTVLSAFTHINQMPQPSWTTKDFKLNKILNNYLSNRDSWPRAAFFFSVFFSRFPSREAATGKIGNSGIVDSNVNSHFSSWPLPGNDDAIESMLFYYNLFSTFLLRKKISRVIRWLFGMNGWNFFPQKRANVLFHINNIVKENDFLSIRKKINFYIFWIKNLIKRVTSSKIIKKGLDVYFSYSRFDEERHSNVDIFEENFFNLNLVFSIFYNRDFFKKLLAILANAITIIRESKYVFAVKKQKRKLWWSNFFKEFTTVHGCFTFHAWEIKKKLKRLFFGDPFFLAPRLNFYRFDRNLRRRAFTNLNGYRNIIWRRRRHFKYKKKLKKPINYYLYSWRRLTFLFYFKLYYSYKSFISMNYIRIFSFSKSLSFPSIYPFLNYRGAHIFQERNLLSIFPILFNFNLIINYSFHIFFSLRSMHEEENKLLIGALNIKDFLLLLFNKSIFNYSVFFYASFFYIRIFIFSIIKFNFSLSFSKKIYHYFNALLDYKIIYSDLCFYAIYWLGRDLKTNKFSPKLINSFLNSNFIGLKSNLRFDFNLKIFWKLSMSYLTELFHNKFNCMMYDFLNLNFYFNFLERFFSLYYSYLYIYNKPYYWNLIKYPIYKYYLDNISFFKYVISSSFFIESLSFLNYNLFDINLSSFNLLLILGYFSVKIFNKILSIYLWFIFCLNSFSIFIYNFFKDSLWL